jgi:hypothetical protein
LIALRFEERPRRGIFKRIGLVFLAVAVCFQVLTYFVSMVIGFSLFFITPLGIEAAQQVIEGFSFYLFVFPLFIPVPISIGVFFTLIWFVFWICLILNWIGPRLSFPQALKRSISAPFKETSRNYLFIFPLLASMLFIAEITIKKLQETHGIPTGQLPFVNPFLLYFSASHAAIIEELEFRLIPIGIAVAVIIFFESKIKIYRMNIKVKFKIFALEFLHPEEAKKKVKLVNVESNGWIGGLTAAEWSIVLASAVCFGLAHVLAGSGWGPGKFTLAFIAGLAFSWVYLAYGITASILLHWFHNYYLVTYWLGVSYSSEVFQTFSLATGLTIFLMGVLGWIVLMVYMVMKLFKRRIKASVLQV